jgi:hypothetical protein
MGPYNLSGGLGCDHPGVRCCCSHIPKDEGDANGSSKVKLRNLKKQVNLTNLHFEVATTGINLLNVLFDSQKYSSGP